MIFREPPRRWYLILPSGVISYFGWLGVFLFFTGWIHFARCHAAQSSERVLNGSEQADVGLNENSERASAGSQVEFDAARAPRAVGEMPAEPVAIVLGYHQFDRRGNKYSTSSSVFSQHLDLIAKRGWEVISLERLVNFLEGGPDIPMKSVVLTVDDGYRSVYQSAWPILRRRELPWTFFIYTDFISVGGGACTWAQLSEIAKSGAEIQSHSKSHAFLNRRGERNDGEYAAFLETELLESKRIIERQIGRPVWAHAYPYGAWNRVVRDAAIGYGFRALLTVDPQPVTRQTSPYSIGRVIISTDNESQLDEFLAERTLGVHAIEPVPGQKLTTPLTLIRLRLLEPEKLVDLRIRVGRQQNLPLRLNPVTGDIVAMMPFEEPAGTFRVVVTARDLTTGGDVETSWRFQILERSVTPTETLQTPLEPAREGSEGDSTIVPIIEYLPGE